MLFDEDLITINEARALLPRVKGKWVSLPTVWRWCTSGIAGVKLESRRLGNRLFTTKTALDEFGKRLAEAGPLPHPRRIRAKSKPKAAADRRADAELAQHKL